jgi:hypothetical protein
LSSHTDISSLYGSLQIIVGVFSALFAGIAIWITQHYQAKNFNREGMLRAFDLLSNEENKTHRRRTYEAYCSEKFDSEGKLLDSAYLTDIEYMRTTFGQIGSLVKDGNIPMNSFLETYEVVVIRLWKSLEKNIHRERILRQADNYMKAFEWLFNRALEHWRMTNINSQEPEPCNEITSEIMITNRNNTSTNSEEKELQESLKSVRHQLQIEELKLQIAELKNQLESEKLNRIKSRRRK